MKAAIIGLLESGKSTLFAAISGKALHPMGLTAIDEAIVPVPDERLDRLAAIHHPGKVVHGTVDCLDVPGFNFTDEHGRTAARRYIDKIHTVELLVLLIRAFDDPALPPYRDTVNPQRDLAELRSELLLADLDLVATRIHNLEKQIHKPAQTQARDRVELALQKRLQEAIEAEKPISTAIQNDAEREMVKSLGFLTLKPMVIAVNVGENQLNQTFDLSNIIPGAPVISICAKIEYELSQLDPESRREFMADIGISESAVAKFVNSCYSALGLISFLTVGSDEVRAWPIRQGTVALDAAGKVHTDIKRGFIRAETIHYDDLKTLGSEKAARAAGKVHLEGKDYVVHDGDIINFRFNV